MLDKLLYIIRTTATFGTYLPIDHDYKDVLFEALYGLANVLQIVVDSSWSIHDWNFSSVFFMRALIQAIGNLEVVMELVVDKAMQQHKSLGIFLTESLKALLRVCVLLSQHNQGIIFVGWDRDDLEELTSLESYVKSYYVYYERLLSDSSSFRNKTSHSDLSYVSVDGRNAEELALFRSIVAAYAHQTLLAEMLYTARPAVYTFLVFWSEMTKKDSNRTTILLKTRCNWDSTSKKWVAFLLSLVMELLSIKLLEIIFSKLREESAKKAANHSDVPYTKFEEILQVQTKILRHDHRFDSELRNRKLQLFLYLLRNPLFDKFSAPLARSLLPLNSKLSYLSNMSNYIYDLLDSFNAVYFYHANS